jgi:hypothetical protein
MSRVHGAAFSLAVFASMIVASTSARAAPPQFGLGVTVGAAGVGKHHEVWDETVFHLGARGDMMFGRGGSTGFGIGPYVEVMTHDFGELQTGAGGSVLIPVTELYPIVLSGGGYLRVPWRERDAPGPIADRRYGVEPGIAGTIFLGTRSFNFHNSYEITVGVIGQARFGLGDSHETSFVVAAQLDMAAIWVPWVFVIHGVQESPEAAKIK